MRIACVGIAVQDRLYYVDQLPEHGGKFVATDYREIGGGPAATAAVTIARLGGQVDFIGRVGDDSTGQAIITELENYAVNTRFTRIIKQARSSQSAIIVDKQGERIIINHPSPDLPDESSWLEEIDFSQYDAVLADVRWHQGAELAFTLAKRAGVPTLLDADTTPQDITPLIALADHIAFSQPGLHKVSQQSMAEAGLQQAAKLTTGRVYVTVGKEGCYWLEDNKLHHQAGFTVNVVDTTGAGDVFHGALALAIAQQENSANAIRFANAVAALKCTRPGGRAGIPDIDHIQSFLSDYM